MSKNFATIDKATLAQEGKPLIKQLKGKHSASKSKTLQKQEKAELIISEMEQELNNIKGFIANQLLGIARKHNGHIPPNDKECEQMCDSLLNASPEKKSNNGDVKSVLRTINSLNAKMKQAVTQYDIEPKCFKDFKKKIEHFDKDIRNQLASEQGIREIITQPLKVRLLEAVPLLNVNKQVIFTEIISSIKIAPDLQMHMLQKDYKASPSVQKLINSVVLEKLAIKIEQSSSQIFGYFNEKQFGDKANREEVNKELANGVNNILAARSLVLLSTAKLTEGKKLNKKQSENLEKQTEKITSILCPIIAKCNGTYLENNKAQIIAQLTKDLKSSAGHNIKNKFTISTKKLINLSKQFTETYNKQSETVTTEQNIPAISEVKETPNVMSKARATTMELQETANGGNQYQTAKQPTTLQESTVKQESFNISKDMLAISSPAEQQEKLINNHDLLLPQKTPTLAAPTVSNKELSAAEINQYYTNTTVVD